MHSDAEKYFYEGAISDDPLVYFSMEKKISSWKAEMRTDAIEALKEPLIIFDEALRFLFALEEHYRGMEPITNSGTFNLQLAKVRCDVLSIRELVLLGQGSTANAIARSFIEDIEVTMAILIDSQFADDYADPDQKEFWSNNIGYGKIKVYIDKFMTKAGSDGDYIDETIQRHRELKTYLSSHVHASYSSAFGAALPASMDSPGKFSPFPLGFVDKNMTRLYLSVAEVVYMFSAAFIKVLVGKDPPALIAMDHKGPTFNELIASANALQELIVNHSHRVYEEHQAMEDAWDAAFSDD